MIEGISASGVILPERTLQATPGGIPAAGMTHRAAGDDGCELPPVLAQLCTQPSLRHRLYQSVRPEADPRLINQPALFYELLGDLCLLTGTAADPAAAAAFPVLSGLLENTLLLLSHKNLMIKV